MKRTMMESNL
ncbi:hypothetical protein QR98_0011320 [Sarcoptes scabiei]|uniref:Uncharacterized protein n=1 Tax=Sarcoptes scabiei TaxID=52283 RepID=A0A131ZVC7_SARSC|nr:hypothetical protein QR98_0011320 [Sarcoptes scabiei]